ncbi:PWI domain-containing protein [Didymella exigua CBS 183.55]|uniref:PWI domain-containing protein n=1 Tax=Didymella exigua CBS 183.55 TaxID=1150837 RepID=A0A6A5RXW7_9PLEO|nr:PWI domain-containing protein [Didymella exigua CBS 183.55]KAF1932443.1 PWI domain-containing protein [Didymella exigua CBS 183.55]
MALSIDQKRLKATKFPPEFDRKVDIEKVNIDLMKKWIAQKITDILGDEDDIVVETCYNLIEQNQSPNIKEIQIQLTGFLNKDTPAFCKELWDLMLSAQESPMGVPKEMLEAKKLELQQEQLSKAAAESRRKEQSDQDDIVEGIERTEGIEVVVVDEAASAVTIETVQIGEIVATVEDTEAIEVEEEAETSTVDHHAETRVHRPQGAGHLHAASVTSMSRMVAVVEDAAVLVRETVARPQAAGLVLHRLDAPAAPLLPIARAHHRDAEDALPQAAAQGLHPADRGARPLHDASGGTVNGTKHGPLATTAEGYPGTHLDLLPPKRKRAHQHPGCQGHDLARRRVADAQDQAVHGL